MQTNQNSIEKYNKICQGIDYVHPFNGPLSGTTQLSRYQKGKTNLDFTEARDSEWQWHQLGRMQVCTLLQTDNHASTLPQFFFRCPSCCPTNRVEVLLLQKVLSLHDTAQENCVG